MNPYHALAYKCLDADGRAEVGLDDWARRHGYRGATATTGAEPSPQGSSGAGVAIAVGVLGVLLYLKVAKNPAEARAAETVSDYGG